MNRPWRRFRIGGKLFETNGPVVRPAREMDAMEIEAIIQRHAVHAAEHPCWQSMHIASPRHTGGCWYLRLEYRRSPLFALFPLEVLGNAVRDETGMDVVQAQWIALEHGVGAVWFWKAPRKEEAG